MAPRLRTSNGHVCVDDTYLLPLLLQLVVGDAKRLPPPHDMSYVRVPSDAGIQGLHAAVADEADGTVAVSLLGVRRLALHTAQGGQESFGIGTDVYLGCNREGNFTG